MYTVIDVNGSKLLFLVTVYRHQRPAADTEIGAAPRRARIHIDVRYVVVALCTHQRRHIFISHVVVVAGRCAKDIDGPVNAIRVDRHVSGAGPD